jgi:hypothetical protein
MVYEGSERWGLESWCVIKVRITVGCDVEVCRRGALISYAGGREVSDGSSPDFAEIEGPGVRKCWARMDTYPFATVVETGLLQNVLNYHNDRGELASINIVSDTPEPARLALLGIMGAGGACYGWRRRKQAMGA